MPWPRPAEPAAPFPAPACPLTGVSACSTLSVRHLADVARHLPHDTARIARFFIGIASAAYIGIFSVAQQAGIASVSGAWVLACAEAAAEQEVLAVSLLKGLAEGGGFLAVAAPEVGELGGQRAHDA